MSFSNKKPLRGSLRLDLMGDQTISILGCGWLGFPLAKHLVQLGFLVKGSTTTKDKFSLLKGSQITPFYIEAIPQLSGDDIGSFFQSKILVLTIPFRRTLEDPDYYKQQIDSVIAHVEKSPVEFVIFSSSTSIYPASMKMASEDVEITPDNPRSETLMNVERALRSNQNFETTILRFSGLYGGKRRIGQILAGREGLPDGESPVNLIHLEDCIEIVTQIIKKDIRNETMNVCSDGHPTRQELYIKAAHHHDLKPPQFSSQPTKRFKIVSNAKLKSKLKYTFTHPDPLNFK